MRAQAADAIGVVGAQGGVRAVGQMQRDRIERRTSLISQAQFVCGEQINANANGDSPGILARVSAQIAL